MNVTETLDERLVPHFDGVPYFTRNKITVLIRYIRQHYLRGGGVFLEEESRSRQRKRDIVLGTWKIKSRLKLGNACYYSVQNLLSSSLLSKNLKIKIYRTVILLLFCMGVKLDR